MIERMCCGYERSNFAGGLDHLPVYVAPHLFKPYEGQVINSQGACAGCEAYLRIETMYLINKGEKE